MHTDKYVWGYFASLITASRYGVYMLKYIMGLVPVDSFILFQDPDYKPWATILVWVTKLRAASFWLHEIMNGQFYNFISTVKDSTVITKRRVYLFSFWKSVKM